LGRGTVGKRDNCEFGEFCGLDTPAFVVVHLGERQVRVWCSLWFGYCRLRRLIWRK
jgi:hypothetical protein